MGSKANSRKELKARSLEAVERFLQLKGCEVLDTRYKCEAGKVDMVIRDECGALVFADVDAEKDPSRGMPVERTGEGARARFERIAAAWLAEHGAEVVPCDMRHDLISLVVVDSGHAMLRWHKGVSSMG